MKDKRNKAVYCFDLDKDFINSVQASKETGVCRTSITKACSGTRETAGGMLWCYSKNKAKFNNMCAE